MSLDNQGFCIKKLCLLIHFYILFPQLYGGHKISLDHADGWKIESQIIEVSLQHLNKQ